MARALLARHPNVEVLDARESGYDDSVHIDLLRLEVHGARVFSNDLADHLLNQTPSATDHWAAMPPLAGRTGRSRPPSSSALLPEPAGFADGHAQADWVASRSRYHATERSMLVGLSRVGRQPSRRSALAVL